MSPALKIDLESMVREELNSGRSTRADKLCEYVELQEISVDTSHKGDLVEVAVRLL